MKVQIPTVRHVVWLAVLAACSRIPEQPGIDRAAPSSPIPLDASLEEVWELLSPELLELDDDWANSDVQAAMMFALKANFIAEAMRASPGSDDNEANRAEIESLLWNAHRNMLDYSTVRPKGSRVALNPESYSKLVEFLADCAHGDRSRIEASYRWLCDRDVESRLCAHAAARWCDAKRHAPAQK